MATGKPLLDKLLASRVKRPTGQFGQSNDASTDNGALGCTHTIWQYVIWVYTGKWYSHDQITHLSGYPFGGGASNRGMNVDEAKRLISATHIPYVYKPNLSASNLLTASNIGPAMFAMRYGNWPNWYHYRGSPGAPFARPLGHAGRNQFSGFFGSHAGLLLGYQRLTHNGGQFLRNDCFVVEPNHDSPARPENVPYDVVTQTELANAYMAVRTILHWSATMAFVPSRSPTFPGGL